jgi:hypothetical protein
VDCSIGENRNCADLTGKCTVGPEPILELELDTCKEFVSNTYQQIGETTGVNLLQIHSWCLRRLMFDHRAIKKHLFTDGALFAAAAGNVENTTRVSNHIGATREQRKG